MTMTMNWRLLFVLEFSLGESGLESRITFFVKKSFKGPLKYLLMPLLEKNQLAITLHLYASIGPNLDNTHRGHI